MVDLKFFENCREIVFLTVRQGAVLCFESLLLCTLHHLTCGINSKSTEIQCRRLITATLELRQWHDVVIPVFIKKFEQIKYHLLIFVSLTLNR